MTNLFQYEAVNEIVKTFGTHFCREIHVLNVPFIIISIPRTPTIQLSVDTDGVISYNKFTQKTNDLKVALTHVYSIINKSR